MPSNRDALWSGRGENSLDRGRIFFVSALEKAREIDGIGKLIN
jgi:hypothetical protein